MSNTTIDTQLSDVNTSKIQNNFLMSYVLQTFGECDDTIVWNALEVEQPVTLVDFLQCISNALSRRETNMYVGKSSTWAICQEQLGKLVNRNDVIYASSRVGIWRINIQTVTSCTSFREVIEGLKEMYPEFNT